MSTTVSITIQHFQSATLLQMQCHGHRVDTRTGRGRECLEQNRDGLPLGRRSPFVLCARVCNYNPRVSASITAGILWVRTSAFVCRAYCCINRTSTVPAIVQPTLE